MTEAGGEAGERITQLHAVAADLQSTSEKDAVYDAIIDAAVDILGFDWCAVAVPVDGYFELKTVSRAAPLEVGERVLRVDEGVAGRTYQNGETVIFKRGDEHEDAKPIRDSITSGLSVPLGEWGIFQGIAEEPSAFDDRDREAAELLASHTTAALARIERERELRAKNERLEQFAGVVSHDLRNPLNVAQLRLALVREECESDHISDVERALDRIEQLVDDLLSLARMEDSVDEREPVDLGSIARTCWVTFDSSAGTLEVETDLTVRANESRLRQLVENLVRNALEHAGPEVTVRIGSLEDGFYVEDDGPGIPPDERDTVFEMGYSSDDAGTGFGLAIVSEVVDAHGWEITLTESADGGARFEITGVTAET